MAPWVRIPPPPQQSHFLSLENNFTSLVIKGIMPNEFQKSVKKFMDDNSINNPIENRMLDLIDEVGEVAKEINKMSQYGTSEPKFREEIKLEIGDAFYSLITVANYYDIDILDSLEKAIDKYKKRVEKKGDPGSGND